MRGPIASSSSSIASRQPTHADKRAAHNAIERARRESLNCRFLELAQVIPSLASTKKPSKSIIVSKSIDHITDLTTKMEVKDRALKSLRDRVGELLEETNRLRDMCGLPKLEPDAPDEDLAYAKEFAEKAERAKAAAASQSPVPTMPSSPVAGMDPSVSPFSELADQDAMDDSIMTGHNGNISPSIPSPTTTMNSNGRTSSSNSNHSVMMAAALRSLKRAADASQNHQSSGDSSEPHLNLGGLTLAQFQSLMNSVAFQQQQQQHLQNQQHLHQQQQHHQPRDEFAPFGVVPSPPPLSGSVSPSPIPTPVGGSPSVNLSSSPGGFAGGNVSPHVGALSSSLALLGMDYNNGTLGGVPFQLSQTQQHTYPSSHHSTPLGSPTATTPLDAYPSQNSNLAKDLQTLAGFQMHAPNSGMVSPTAMGVTDAFGRMLGGSPTLDMQTQQDAIASALLAQQVQAQQQQQQQHQQGKPSGNGSPNGFTSSIML
ncbi:hypothetical protein HDU97_006215 [Phlyctochytrium planicorne]|nr:hypothetical protein HDU97_006215 [Phlyctochytrium planicorne]